MPNELIRLREEIKKSDSHLIDILAKRVQLGREIYKIEADEGSTVFTSEQQQIQLTARRTEALLKGSH